MQQLILIDVFTFCGLTGGEPPLKCFIIITMKSVTPKKSNLEGILTGSIEYVIPFFQRRYSWGEEQWNELWDSVLSIYNGEREKEYFMGCIITKDEDLYPVKKGVREINLVDGQQRMITISILLKVMHNHCTGKEDLSLKAEIDGLLYLKKGSGFLRIRCSDIDRASYSSLMATSIHEEVKSLDDNKGRLYKCYRFFQEKVQKIDNISQASVKDKLARIIIGREKEDENKCLAFITIFLNDESNEQEIFDTINSFGVKLRDSELIKNFIFNDRFWGDRKEAEKVYTDYWLDEFEFHPDKVGYWGKKITRGGADKPHNLESFLLSFLIIVRSRDNYSKVKEITMNNLCDEYKKLVKDYHGKKKLMELLNDLNSYARTYHSIFVDIDDDEEISFNDWDRRLLVTLKRINTTTPDPLLLYHFHTERNKLEREHFIKILDSYLVRRAVCGLLLTRSVFVEPLIKISSEGVSFADFLHALPEDDLNRYPAKVEFKQCFKDKSHKNAFLILYSIALQQMKDSMSSKITYKLSVEHIIPQTWKGTSWRKSDMSHEDIMKREKSIPLIGNLTLVKGNLNSSLGNDGWVEKKNKLRKHCLMPITTSVLEKDEWDEEAIDERADELFMIANKVWPELKKQS